MKYVISFLIGSALLLAAHYVLGAIEGDFVLAALGAGVATTILVELNFSTVWAIILAALCSLAIALVQLSNLAVFALWVLVIAMIAKPIAAFVLDHLPSSLRPSH